MVLAVRQDQAGDDLAATDGHCEQLSVEQRLERGREMKQPTEQHYIEGLQRLIKMRGKPEDKHTLADALVCEFLNGQGHCELVKWFKRVKEQK